MDQYTLEAFDPLTSSERNIGSPFYLLLFLSSKNLPPRKDNSNVKKTIPQQDVK